HIFNTFYEWELSTFIGYLLCVGVVLWTVTRWALKGGPTQPEGRALRWSCLVPLVTIAIVGWIDLTNYLYYPSDGVVFRTRNFFGTLVVLEADKGDPDHYRLFKHGATVHGLQFVEAQRSGQPTTYYTPYGGVGRTINFLHGIKQAPPVDKDSSLQELTTSKSPESTAGQAKGLNIGAVGLGVGTLAAYAGPGDT